MTSKISDQDVLNLLSSLKNAEGNYPSDMIQSRRDTYRKQAAAMAVLAGARGNGSSASGSTQTTASSITASTASGGVSMGTLLETALVVSLVVEAGVAAYIYRDKIADFINSTISPKVETVASPPGNSASDILTGEETSTDTPEETITVIVTETPSPYVTLFPAAGNNNNNGDSGGDSQVLSTPNPNDDPGLHLGQTKQPTADPKPDQNNNKDKNNNVDNHKGKND